ncbi:hypothetical protein BD769DRAFT_590375 [Suillus cothurnatus]|nr:hypothetical protein BD769DRAFT_590375 [Suillus cothurnatus]
MSIHVHSHTAKGSLPWCGLSSAECEEMKLELRSLAITPAPLGLFLEHAEDLGYAEDPRPSFKGLCSAATQRRLVKSSCNRGHLRATRGLDGRCPCSCCITPIPRQTRIKREIGHLCHDEHRPPKTGGKQSSDAVPAASSNSADPARSMTRGMHFHVYSQACVPPIKLVRCI